MTYLTIPEEIGCDVSELERDSLLSQDILDRGEALSDHPMEKLRRRLNNLNRVRWKTGRGRGVITVKLVPRKITAL